MNLENVTVEMRPRNEWEATDFGARMVRRDAAPIYKVWFAVTLPLVAIAMLIIFLTPYASFAMLFYWWFEPVADGPILRIISRRLFGEDANVGAALRAVPGLAWKNRLFILTPYRFHFARSIAMPVTQLEGLGGATRRSRSKVLNMKIFNYGLGITTAYEHLVLALYFGIMLTGYALVPAVYQHTLGDGWMEIFWRESGDVATAITLLVFYAAQSALQPWFVGAGFGLYINCRTQLEAWDIEVAFRRIVQRRSSSIATLMVLVICTLPALLSPAPALSQEPDDPGFAGFWSEDEIRPSVDSVMDSEALKTSREVHKWRRIQQEEVEQEVAPRDTAWMSGLIDGLFKTISVIVEFGLWIAVAISLLLVFLTRNRWLPYVGFEMTARPAPRKIYLAGGELTSDQLPDDIVDGALGAWRAGRKRDALSILYRAAVFAAVAEHGVRLPPSATEGACMRAVADQTNPDRSAYFRRIVSAWVLCAYGGQTPEDDSIMPLCSDWPRYFGYKR